MAEDFGVDDRGSFYDAVGALRDVVQNHLLQMLALVAMEPPSAGTDDVDAIRDRRTDLFRAMPAAEPDRYFRGQYNGYQHVDGVKLGSDTETFVALRLEVDNWRWTGVPFYIRAGKAMPVEATEIRVVFKRPPRLGIGGRMLPDPDELIIRVKPEPGAELCLIAKKAGEDALHRVHLDLLFDEQDGPQPEPYERLLRRRAARRPAAVPELRLDRPDLAHRPAAARQHAAGRAVRARLVGPGGRQPPARGPRPLAHAMATG